jgi:hypothetical protein
MCQGIPYWLTLIGLELSVGSHFRVDGDELAIDLTSSNKPVICKHSTGTLTPGPVSRTAALLETQSERDGRIFATGRNRFRVE